MSPRDLGRALLVAVIWGLAFVATRIGLDDLTPPQLAAARFLIAALPVAVLPRPRVAWPALIAVGLTLFAGQFILQFFGIAGGMPPGLASVVVQTQALFTILFAAPLLHERPTALQTCGLILGLAGLAAIALTVGADLTLVGFVLTLGSAISWAVGNLLLKRLPPVPTLDLMVWLSLVPPAPALLLALALDGPGSIAQAVTGVTWRGLAAIVYLGAVATVLAYAIWGDLLRRYPAVAVTPFALLVPFVAAAGSALVFGERFGPLRLGGMALVLLGLAVIVLPWPRQAAA
ncbi:MAG: EamA family transporter [Candidatus Rokuibacteriota bacterium]|nr:MAG: EamA family transporter [Candidatus Rokubacteria bacterium]